MQNILSRIAPSWLRFPSKYGLWRMKITYEESRGYNTTDRVLLTFDDDGTPENIQGILAVLAKEKIKAFFFIKGDWAAANKQNARLIQEIREQGHWVGSHSYDHIRLDRLSKDEIRQQLQKGLRTEFMRPPYGAYDSRVRKVVHELGFKISFWTIDSFDWKGISAIEIQKNVLSKMHKGACVLMHLNAPHTLEALPAIIAGIRERGFEICYDGTEINA